jgi:hypothetical protein
MFIFSKTLKNLTKLGKKAAVAKILAKLTIGVVALASGLAWASGTRGSFRWGSFKYPYNATAIVTKRRADNSS